MARKLKVFSVEVKIYATAYIKARSAKQALEIARGLEQEALHVEGEMISSETFDSPELPDISLSPVMTIHGPDDGTGAEECD